MKRLALFCSLFFVSAAAFGQAPPSNTANYYMLKPESWIDKPVTLSVAWLDGANSAELKDGYRHLRAETINLNNWGGYITVLATPRRRGPDYQAMRDAALPEPDWRGSAHDQRGVHQTG